MMVATITTPSTIASARAKETTSVAVTPKSTLTSRRLTPTAAAMPTFAFGFLAFGALPVLRNEYAKYPDIYFIEWTIVGMVIGLIYKPTP